MSGGNIPPPGGMYGTGLPPQQQPYGGPPAGYGAPPVQPGGYGQPQQPYGGPPAGYGAPPVQPGGYGQSQQPYGGPPAGYGAPPTQPSYPGVSAGFGPPPQSGWGAPPAGPGGYPGQYGQQAPGGVVVAARAGAGPGVNTATVAAAYSHMPVAPMGGGPMGGGPMGRGMGGMMGGETPVTEGARIQLRNVETNQLIHTVRGVSYRHPGGSGQQEVTTAANPGPGTTWEFRPAFSMQNRNGQQQPSGQPIREHGNYRIVSCSSGCSLHSHRKPSPTTKQQECSAFHECDGNDNFRVELADGANGNLHFNQRVVLRHVETGQYLHTHPRPSVPSANMNEVTCYKEGERNRGSVWLVEPAMAGGGMPGMGMPGGGMPGMGMPGGMPGGGMPGMGMGMPAGDFITFGTSIRLRHTTTGMVLHTHNISLTHPRSSRQHEVTCFGSRDDNDWFEVTPENPHAAAAARGQPVAHGQTLTLVHSATQHCLHSHAGIPSPTTGQQEVTGFPRAKTDRNDQWRLEKQHGAGVWRKGERVFLVHVATNKLLHSHKHASRPTSGQQEVTAFQERDDNSLWEVEEVR